MKTSRPSPTHLNGREICRTIFPDDTAYSNKVMRVANQSIPSSITGQKRTAQASQRNSSVARLIRYELYGNKVISDAINTDVWLKACRLCDSLHPEDADV